MKKIYYLAIVSLLLLQTSCGALNKEDNDTPAPNSNNSTSENTESSDTQNDSDPESESDQKEESALHLNLSLKTASDYGYSISKITAKISGEIFTKEITLSINAEKNSASGQFAKVPLGTYNIEIAAFDSDTLIAEGSGAATIEKDMESTAEITLEYFTGVLNIDVTTIDTTSEDQPTLGSRDNPFLFNESQLMPDGWLIEVLAFDADAWAEVQAENFLNDAPGFGKKMVMPYIRVVNESTGSDPNNIDKYDFYMVGSLNIQYSPFGDDSYCGVIPDSLDEDLFISGEGTGNACFQVGKTEVDLLLAYEYKTGEYYYFKLE